MQTRSGQRPRRRIIALVALMSLVAAACSSSEPDSLALADEPIASTTTTTTAAPSTTTTTAAPSTTTTTEAAAATETTTSTIAPDEFRTWIVTALPSTTHLVAYDEPDGDIIPFEFLVPNPHQFGGPMTLMVTEGQPGDDWVQVQLPIRPNGQTGWVQSELYEISETRVRAEVNLSQHQVTVYDGEEIIAETSAVIGSPATPTPLGTFYITAKRRNPENEYFLGPWALALSAFSEVHETFGGGLPVIAIHGTHRPEQVGQARSNGCVRVPNEVVTFLAENVPLGAPVTVSA